MSILSTVKIRHSEVPAGYIVINQSDYDPAKHTLFEVPPSPDPEKPPLMLEVNEVPEKKTTRKTAQPVDQT